MTRRLIRRRYRSIVYLKVRRDAGSETEGLCVVRGLLEMALLAIFAEKRTL